MKPTDEEIRDLFTAMKYSASELTDADMASLRALFAPEPVDVEELAKAAHAVLYGGESWENASIGNREGSVRGTKAILRVLNIPEKAPPRTIADINRNIDLATSVCDYDRLIALATEAKAMQKLSVDVPRK